MIKNILDEVYSFYDLEKNGKVLRSLEKFFITTIVLLIIPPIWIYKKLFLLCKERIKK